MIESLSETDVAMIHVLTPCCRYSRVIKFDLEMYSSVMDECPKCNIFYYARFNSETYDFQTEVVEPM
ncbi:MAG TPA: hypothetical protein ENI23_15570 [bacterium]|nr:hypothetical protein [bacterium]